MTWDLPLDETEFHYWRYDAILDHWFLKFRWAAGLHSLITDEGGGAGEQIELVLGFSVSGFEFDSNY